MESEIVKALGKENDIDLGYFNSKVDAAMSQLAKYGDAEWFLRD